jgi:hypothetical protein
VSLSSLGEQGIAVVGKDVKSFFGRLTNYIGDVNGDGIGDIVVYSTSFQIPKYVIFGTSDIQMDDIYISSLSSTIGFEIQHSDASVSLICSALGDINSDGYDDFMIGDMKYNQNRGSFSVIYGRSSFPSILYISTLTSNERLLISGSNINDYFGKYLSSKAGSVSGCFDIVACSSSRCYVLTCIQPYETAINVDDLIMLDSKYGYIIQGTVISSMEYEILLSGIGDVNGDGLSDFAISSSRYFSGRGVVYVIFGTHVNNNINIDLDTMDISVGIIITHSQDGAGIGSAVSDARDVNGDGVNDIVIGSYAANAFVIYGGSNIINMDLINLGMSQGYSISSLLSDTIVDFRVVGNIDVNHDGISDIAIGCPYDDMAERVYVIYGSNNKYRSNVILESMTSAQGLLIVTSDLSDKSAYYIASAGDYNNDTYRDLLVSAPYAFNKVGAVYVITNSLGSNTRNPTSAPNNLPKPSKRPSTSPSVKPSSLPSVRPSTRPTSTPIIILRSELPTGTETSEGNPTYKPSITNTNQPSRYTIENPVRPIHQSSYIPSRKPSFRPTSYPHTPSCLPSMHPSHHPTKLIVESSTPVNTFHPTSSPSSDNAELNFSQQSRTIMSLKKTTIVILISTFGVILMIGCVYFRYIYKFVMDKIGYDFKKSIQHDTSIRLRVASLEECIEHFWKYRGVIYKPGSVTDDLFTRYGCPTNYSHDNRVLNALDHIYVNPNILCPVSYYKVVCHMADRKSETIRNKAYETLLNSKSVMTKCVTVECIQLLKRILIDCGRLNVKEHAVTILCEISHSIPNMITFDVYDMLRSYKMTTSDTSLLHAIEITLQEVRQHCVHLHTQIDKYEKSLLTTCHNNSNNNIVEIIQSKDNWNHRVDYVKSNEKKVDMTITENGCSGNNDSLGGIPCLDHTKSFNGVSDSRHVSSDSDHNLRDSSSGSSSDDNSESNATSESKKKEKFHKRELSYKNDNEVTYRYNGGDSDDSYDSSEESVVFSISSSSNSNSSNSSVCAYSSHESDSSSSMDSEDESDGF